MPLAFAYSLQVCIQIEVFLSCQILVQTEPLRHIGYFGLDLKRVPAGIVTQHGYSAGIGKH
jgi:hypothetical protein